MSKSSWIIFGFVLLVSLPAFATGTGYSSVIEDLPLMSGMIEKTDDAIVFDKPGGRIVETSIETPASPAEIERFYTEALPPLGWKGFLSEGFVREDERLNINIEQKGRVALVRFSLTPNSEGR